MQARSPAAITSSMSSERASAEDTRYIAVTGGSSRLTYDTEKEDSHAKHIQEPGRSGGPRPAGLFRDVGTTLTRIFLVQILFYGLTGVANAYLNSRRRFFAAAWSPVLPNLIIIVTLLSLPSAGDTEWTLADVVVNDRLRWTLGLGATAGIARRITGAIEGAISCIEGPYRSSCSSFPACCWDALPAAFLRPSRRPARRSRRCPSTSWRGRPRGSRWSRRR